MKIELTAKEVLDIVVKAVSKKTKIPEDHLKVQLGSIPTSGITFEVQLPIPFRDNSGD